MEKKWKRCKTTKPTTRSLPKTTTSFPAGHPPPQDTENAYIVSSKKQKQKQKKCSCSTMGAVRGRVADKDPKQAAMPLQSSLQCLGHTLRLELQK